MEYDFKTRYSHTGVKDRPKDVAMQNQIVARAGYSLAIFGMAFYHRTGRFLAIRPSRDTQKRKSVEDLV